jgi:hypothetical protein
VNRTGMDIRAPRSGIKITYWNGQEDKIEPLKRAANDVVLNNVSCVSNPGDDPAGHELTPLLLANVRSRRTLSSTRPR